jgi:hypothetical protein
LASRSGSIFHFEILRRKRTQLTPSQQLRTSLESSTAGISLAFILNVRPAIDIQDIAGQALDHGNEPFMAQWNTTEITSAAPDKPLLANPHPGAEEHPEQPDATPSAEGGEAGRDRAEALSILEQLRRNAEQWSRQAKVILTGSCEMAQRQVQAAMMRTRQRIGRSAAQKPVHLVAVVALSALLAGVLLRVWRSSRYE